MVSVEYLREMSIVYREIMEFVLDVVKIITFPMESVYKSVLSAMELISTEDALIAIRAIVSATVSVLFQLDHLPTVLTQQTECVLVVSVVIIWIYSNSASR